MRRGAVEVVFLSLRGAGVPLYCFPGIYGNATEYSEIAKEVGVDRPVYGFVCHTLTSGRWVNRGIRDLAEQYAKFIVETAPARQCTLLGWSLGGDLAYETARQLAGVLNVQFVAVVDVSDVDGHTYHGIDQTAGRSIHSDTPQLGFEDWLSKSEMKQQWLDLLGDMNEAEREIALRYLNSAVGSLPCDGPEIGSREYDTWVGVRLAWMMSRYKYRRLQVPLHVWVAEATMRDARLVLRAWSSLTDVKSSQLIRGTTHQSILSHPEFISGVWSKLQAADAACRSSSGI